MINKTSTKYQNVYSQIRDFISSDKWPPGEKIPSENELVDYFNVSRITIRSALSILANDGLIVRKRGKGTVVTSSIPQADNCFESLTQKIIQNGDSPSSVILDFQKITNNNHTEHFNQGEKLYFVFNNNEKKYIPNFLVEKNNEIVDFNQISKGLKLISDYLDKSILRPNNISHPKSRIEFLNLIKE